jgi:hypothetical protein
MLHDRAQPIRETGGNGMLRARGSRGSRAAALLLRATRASAPPPFVG